MDDYPNQYGYIENNDMSMIEAMNVALDSKSDQNHEVLFWDEVVERLLSPKEYKSTNIN